MPIGPRTLKKHTRKYIVMAQDHSLGDALDTLAQKGYEPNETYLVVKGKDASYRVLLCSDVERHLGLIGDSIFDTLLSQLPIPKAHAVVSVDTPESSGTILDEVRQHAGSIVVIVDGTDCVGVFANPNRGIVEDRSLLNLHGSLVDIYREHPLGAKSSIVPPCCPLCGYQNFFKFDPQKKIYICPHCGEEVTQQ